MLLFLFLTYTGQVTAERDIGNYIDLPQAQLQQLELNNFKVLGLSNWLKMLVRIVP